MIDTPQVAELDPTPIAFIHLEVPREKMPEVFGPAVEELVGTITGQGAAIAGPLFAHHLAMNPEAFTFDVGFPVAGAIEPAGRVQAGARGRVKVVRTVYQGGYEGLPEAWSAFQRWIEQSGHEWAPDIWEVYLEGPETTADPTRWRTELNRPLKG